MPKFTGPLARPLPPSARDSESRSRLKQWMGDVVDHIKQIENDLYKGDQDDGPGELGFRGHFENESPRYAWDTDFDLEIDAGVVYGGSTRAACAAATINVPATGAGTLYVWCEIVQAAMTASIQSGDTKPAYDDDTNYNVVIGELEEIETKVWEWKQEQIGVIEVPLTVVGRAAIDATLSGLEYTLDFLSQHSIIVTTLIGGVQKAQLDGDVASPGPRWVYCTDSNGDKGWFELTSVNAITSLQGSGVNLQYKATQFYALFTAAEDVAWSNFFTGAAHTVVTDVQFSGATFQKKTQSLTTMGAAAESDWATWFTAESINVVVDQQETGNTLQEKTKSFYALSPSTTSAWSTYFTAEAIEMVVKNRVDSNKFEEQTQSVWGFNPGVTSAWTAWHTGTTCA